MTKATLDLVSRCSSTTDGQAHTVRLRSKPLNISRYDAEALMDRSISIVLCIMAITSDGFLCDPPPSSRRMIDSASASLPRRTSHHGDSGAKQRIEKMGTGHAHWIAKGILYAHYRRVEIWGEGCGLIGLTSVVPVETTYSTPAAIS